MNITYTTLVGKPLAKRPIGGPRKRWENEMKMNVTGADFKI
jgi:hypothetical protein